MQNEVFDKVREELGAISELLCGYTACGDELLSCANDEEINNCIDRRGQIIEEIKRKRAALDVQIALCEADEADIIQKMLNNKPYRGALSAELTALRGQIAALRSAQLAAVEKDRLAQARLAARFEDIKLKLEELNDDKKKINFYAKSSGGNGVGRSLDSHS